MRGAANGGGFLGRDAAETEVVEFERKKRRIAGANQSCADDLLDRDRKSTRLNSSHQIISYAVFCLKKKKNGKQHTRTSTAHKGVDERQIMCVRAHVYHGL